MAACSECSHCSATGSQLAQAFVCVALPVAASLTGPDSELPVTLPVRLGLRVGACQ